MYGGNIYRSFSSSRRQFLKQSAALAAAVGVAPAVLGAGSGSANAAAGAAYADELWERLNSQNVGAVWPSPPRGTLWAMADRRVR